MSRVPSALALRSRHFRPAAVRTQSLAVIEVVHPYNAFVDESMQSRYGSTVTAVTAYVGAFDRWLALEDEWRGVLRRFEVPLDGKPEHTEPFFHMTDFIARERQFKNDWPNTKRDEFIERLTMTASEYTTLGVGCCVVDDEFRQLPKDVQNEWREPYYFCTWGILSLLLGVEQYYPITIPRPLWFLFDRRKKAVELAASIFYHVKATKDPTNMLGEMGFGEMWKTPQLQAADLLVYETARHKLERDYNLSPSMRKSFERLKRKNRLLIVYLNREYLDKYVQFVRRAQAIEQSSGD